MEFPLFRRYPNEKSYFRIESPTELFELKLVGQVWIKYTVKATQYPEIVMIRDLMTEGLVITEEEFNIVLSKVL
jgi:hypothetical protein